MRCKVCGKETRVICLCGFCPECINRFGHDECHNIVKQKEQENNKPRETDYWKSLSKDEQDRIEKLNK